jgi:hypothetical protein
MRRDKYKSGFGLRALGQEILFGRRKPEGGSRLDSYAD